MQFEIQYRHSVEGTEVNGKRKKKKKKTNTVRIVDLSAEKGGGHCTTKFGHCPA
jgi:hypothetical protein